MDREEFVRAAFDAAGRARAAGAPINPIAAAAQAALESRFGASGLARDANNLFGIKKGGSWTGPVLALPTQEFDPARGQINVVAEFRKYDDWAACFGDYGAIIGRLPFYADAVAAKDDPEGFIRGLAPRDGEPGWATDPRYVAKVVALIDQWRGAMQSPAPPSGERHVVAGTLILNLRSAPSTTAPLVAPLPEGQVVIKVGEAADGQWWRVAAELAVGPVPGFVLRQFLAPAAAAATALPTAALPAVHLRENRADVTRAGTARAFPLGEPGRPERAGGSATSPAASLTAIVDWLDVERSARYSPEDGKTFCNIYAYDYCYLGKAYLPRVWWTDQALVALGAGGRVDPEFGRTLREMTANMLFDWLREHGADFGWRKAADAAALQDAANEGQVAVIAAQRSDLDRPGHICVVVPETGSQAARRGPAGVVVPLQSQAGAQNHRYFAEIWWQDPRFRGVSFWTHP
jgi:hypothetical protein